MLAYMTFSHLNLPWVWEDCVDKSLCDKAVHLDEDSDALNSQPREWVQLLLGNCRITETVIIFLDDNGKSHNDDGPAVETLRGGKEWKQHGVFHRANGPAKVEPGRRLGWYFNGKLHREDGPAIEYADGRKRWYRHGVRHREDGPAFINADGTERWYINGVIPEKLETQS